MLTPLKIKKLTEDVNTKHTQPLFGKYPTHKKIINYITRRMREIYSSDVSELTKVKEMTNLLEGRKKSMVINMIILK